MDLPSLAGILQATLSLNPDEQKAAEQSLNQFQFAPQHLVRLLQIIVDNNCDMGVRQIASIHFKNFVAEHWCCADSDTHQKILQSDKDIVKDHILMFITQVPPLLRVQLGECLLSIICFEYPHQWPNLLDWVKHNLQQDQKVYGALFVLWILSKDYEFMGYERYAYRHTIVEETFPHLLNLFNRLVQNVNPSLEVADLIKLICKIFWSFTHKDIPKILSNQNILNVWLMLFLNVLERPVPSEGQPVDPELRKSWGWWKVKKWTVRLLNRLYSNWDGFKWIPKCRVVINARKTLECYLNLLNAIRVGGYLPDRVISMMLQYLIKSILFSRDSFYTVLQPWLDVLLLEIVFPLTYFKDNDQKLWDEDPHEYARKGYEPGFISFVKFKIEALHDPRIAAMYFVSKLVWCQQGEECLSKFIQFIVEIFRRCDEASIEYKPYRQKDGALLAIGALCDKLKWTEPYKSELERMLVQHVFPEFNSPVGHLRAKAAWVAGKYADFNFPDQNNFQRALQCVVSGMKDPELPVRVDSILALRSFIKACKDLNQIRSILPQLLDDFFKFMNGVENKDLVLILETIVDKFGDEITPYALRLCQNSAASFWRHMNNAEADYEADLRAISTILESVNRLPNLFVQIEPTLLQIIRRVLTIGGQEVFEKVLEIVSYMTFFSPTISLDMWTLWPLMMEALAHWDLNFFPNISVSLRHFISRGTAHFLTCKEPDYQQSLWNMISSIMSDQNMEDNDIEPAPKLIEVVFQNCRGQVDHWVEPYLRIIVERLRRTKESNLKCLLIQVIADAVYYNAELTLSILQKLGVASEIFLLWFHFVQQANAWSACFKRGHDKKVCSLGLTSLLALSADQLPEENFSLVFSANICIIGKYDSTVVADDLDDDYGYEHARDKDHAIRLREMAEQSPIDKLDPAIFFLDTIEVIKSSDSLRLRYENLIPSFEASLKHVAQIAAGEREWRQNPFN